MKQRLALALGALMVSLAPLAWGDAYVPPDYQKLCTEGVTKLALGEQVIGTSQANIAAAEAARVSAQKSMQQQDYYSCWESVSKGLKALDAG